MKTASFVLKIVALALTTAAAVCAVIAFWDKILDGVGIAVNKVRTRGQHAEGCSIPSAEDEEDYADWDE